MNWHKVVTVCAIFHHAGLIFARQPASFRIGSVFLERDLLVHQTFGLIFDELNEDSNYLNGTRVDYNIQYSDLDQFDAYQKACMEMTYRVVAIFGNSPSIVDSSVASVCSALKVPYLTSHPVLASSDYMMSRKFAVHLGPSQIDLIQAVKDTIDQLKWAELALISHRETGSLDAHQLMELLQSQGIKVRLLDLKRGDIRPGLADLRNRGIQNFLVDIGAEYLKLFFEEAMKTGIVHENSAFLSASLDLTTVDMEDLRHTGSSIMGFTILDTENYELAKTSGEMSQDLSALVSRSHKAALIYDGVHLFSRAVEKLIIDTDLMTPQVGCDNKDAPYDLGDRLLKEINAVTHEGLTGKIWIKNGLRQTVNMAILHLDRSGQFSQIGAWSKHGNEIQVNLTKPQKSEIAVKILAPVIVKTRLPSNFMKKSMGISMGADNDPRLYEGFLKDLLDLLAQDLDFDYLLEDESTHGFLNSDGTWTGLLGSLVDREAHMGLDDLTVTSQRSQVVDFSAPYETSTLQVMIQKSVSEAKGMSVQSFFDPLSLQVWLSILVAYVLVSLLMFIIARVSPYERHAPRSDPAHRFTLANSFWYTLAAFFLRSTPISPRSFSTRILSAFWWLFCLVILFIYMISLKSLIFPKSVSNPHLTLDDLLRDETFQFVLYPRGSTQFLLQNSQDELHQRIWSKVDQKKSELVSSLSIGAEIVSQDPSYGFIIESVQAELILQEQFCSSQLDTIGDLGQRHYALAFPKGSDLVDKVSKQILSYGESGALYRLKNKWAAASAKNCSSKMELAENEANLVRAIPYSGPFMLLLFAGLTALVIAFIELVFYSILRSKRATICLPNGGPTSSKGGKSGAVFKEELTNVISFSSMKRLSKNFDVNQQQPVVAGNGNHVRPLSPRINRFTARHNNGIDIIKAPNGVKNGQHNFYQTQALLRKDSNLDQEDNAQL